MLITHGVNSLIVAALQLTLNLLSMSMHSVLPLKENRWILMGTGGQSGSGSLLRHATKNESLNQLLAMITPRSVVMRVQRLFLISVPEVV